MGFDPSTLLPRAQWPQHPRWPIQTLLLSSHESFRGWSGWILERVRALDPADPTRVRHRARKLPRLATDFRWWMSGMKGHERYEESKLYPFLAGRWDADFAHLEAGHVVLNERKQRVFAGFELTVPGEPDEIANHESLTGELERHRELLLAHLAEEEELVIPLLLALSPEEFADLTTLPTPALLARFD